MIFLKDKIKALMTDKEIIEGNILIAEFMGLEMRDETTVLYKRYKGFDGLFHNAQNLSYYTIWDWLMPVVEKICKSGYFNYEISNNHCWIWKQENEVIEIANKEGESTIESVWLAVVEFIKWYNTQKSELPEPLK